MRVVDPQSGFGPVEGRDSVAKSLTPISGELLRSVRVSLEVRLGRATMTVEEMLALKAGSVVELESGLADHADIYLNDVLIARGEIVAVGDKYGVRVVDILSSHEPAS
jgi:flagellar motor switch protein FliN/FliY